jgi:hypothetical protein
MSKKLISAQAPFTMLVPVHRGGSNPSRGRAGNPVVKRQTMTLQHFPEIPGRGPDLATHSPQTPGIGTRVGHMGYTTPGIPLAATGVITVATNVFAGPTTVLLGQYLLTSGVEFLIGGSTDATALALSDAIDVLPGYSASVVASDITVTGPFGVIGNSVVFKSGGSSPANLTFSPSDGSMDGAEPTLGPVVIG